MTSPRLPDPWPHTGPATADQVIAYNVRRLRQTQGLTVAQLAERLEVGRHAVYDFERPRPGANQRPFPWTDLIKLCSAFRVTLFELVLPPPGVEVDLGELLPYVGGEAAKAEAEKRGDEELIGWLTRGDRTRLGELLFGLAIPYDGKLLRDVRRYQRQLAERDFDATKRVVALLDDLITDYERAMEAGHEP